MDVGMRQAKNDLSKLIQAMRDGEPVYLTKRGARVAQLVPIVKAAPGLGRGSLKGKVNLYPGWDSPEEDRKIEEMFEVV